MKPLPPANYLRMKRRAKNFLRRQLEDVTCPGCGAPFPPMFLLKASAFSEVEKKMGAKQIECPSCKVPLWHKIDGTIVPSMNPPEPPEPKIKRFGWIRCLICIAIRRVLGRKKVQPPDST